MPFRSKKHNALTRTLHSQQRTGEPFPPSSNRWGWNFPKPDGYGKAAGSYTYEMRKQLALWMEERLGSWTMPLTFEYKLSRHKKVIVTGSHPYIKHNPGIGFTLMLSHTSIDGLPTKFWFGNRVAFAWNRIVAKERFLSLSEGTKQIQG